MRERVKEAGPRRHPATNNRQMQSYHLVEAASRGNPTADALGGLLLAISGQPLPLPERRVAWELVKRWTTELVDSKHVAGAP